MWTATVVLALAAGVALVLIARRGHPPEPVDYPRRSPSAVDTSQPVAVPFVSASELSRLPEVSTDATIAAAPRDPQPSRGTAGVVVHNRQPLPVFTAPGGKPFARLPVSELGNDTWLPVISDQPGWLQVLLPSRPNGSTGWLEASRVTIARSRYQIRVDLNTARLRLLHDGKAAGTWQVSTGTTHTPTPAGRTFVLAAITDPKQAFSPVILPLGIHSTALDTYAGGPGTVGIHTWARNGLTGRPASHGCIRVPPAALRTLTEVPLGSLVRIYQR